MWASKKAASDEHSHQNALCGLLGLRVPWLWTWLCSGTGRWRWRHDWRGGWGELDRQQADLWAHRCAQEGGSGAVCCLLGNPLQGSQVEDMGCTCVWGRGIWAWTSCRVCTSFRHLGKFGKIDSERCLFLGLEVLGKVAVLVKVWESLGILWSTDEIVCWRECQWKNKWIKHEQCSNCVFEQ